MHRGKAWLSVQEASEIIGVSRRTIQRWCKVGKLPAYLVATEWRISVKKLSEQNMREFMMIRATDAGDSSK